MKLVVLTGIPGSGSTTVLNKTLEEVDYLHLNYGDIMTEIAIEEKIVEDRDSLRKLSAETQKEIQKKYDYTITVFSVQAETHEYQMPVEEFIKHATIKNAEQEETEVA